jgi:hypothetical protein
VCDVAALRLHRAGAAPSRDLASPVELGRVICGATG